ncbi:DUF7882 family protein [Leifsonia aquatica]
MVCQGSPLRFHFDGSKAPQVDRDWVERLMESAASNTGLIAIDEEGEPLVGRLVVCRAARSVSAGGGVESCVVPAVAGP